MADPKQATTNVPIHELIRDRWSPYAFDRRPVKADDLRSLFEAARWAASSYNAQPWSYIVATQEQAPEFERILSCLVEGNRKWAKNVPVLALGVSTLNFAHDGKPNAAAIHDLGLASANIVFEATARGLSVHQMIGILPDHAQELYAIPAGSRAITALAIGYRADPASAPAELAERDKKPRTRKPLAELVFTGRWGSTAGFVGSGSGASRA